MNARWMFSPAIALAGALGGLVLMHGAVRAQGAFPAPLPNAASNTTPSNNASSPFPPVNSQSPFPPVNSQSPSPFPPVGQSSFPSGGAAPITGGFSAPPQEQAGEPPCMKDFTPLRTETQRRAKLVQDAGHKKVGPDEACKLIGSFSEAEAKMLKFVQVNAKSCGIPPEIASQIQDSHVKTGQLLKRVCDAAAQQRSAGAGGGASAGPSLSEIIGSPSLPGPSTKKAGGGSTFDTINGNVLAR